MLKTRVMTALVLVPTALALILFAPWQLVAGASAALFLLAAWEWSAFLALGERQLRLVYVLLTAVLMVLTAVAWRYYHAYEWVIWAGAVWWVIAGLAIAASRLPTAPLVAAIGGPLTLIPAWLALNLLLEFAPERWILVLVLALVWATDVGAYFAGKLFGDHALAPVLSPNKTWEGVAGGLLLAGIVSVLAAYVLERDLLTLLPLAAATALISVQGDLLVSAFKRRVGLKDCGTIFPGHGGVMDRFDSLCAALPIALATIWLLGV